MVSLHEWALAESIILTAVEEAKKAMASKIKRIIIVVGELQTIDIDVLKFALEEIKKGTIAENAIIEYVYEKPKFRCNVCGYEWEINSLSEILDEDAIESIHFIPELSLAFLRCPKCGKQDFSILKGRGIYIKEIEVVTQ